MTENRRKTVALFGGSFNPPHTGHFETGAYIHETLKPDEVWMMYSLNPDKDPAAYAPLQHRMAMGRMLAADYPGVPFVMSDAEERSGEHETANVLDYLQKAYPDTRFIWVMGVDNLLTFQHWHNAEKIFENFPIAVLKRPPHTEEQALGCAMAKTFAHLRCTEPAQLQQAENGWILLENPQTNFSSHGFVNDLKKGVPAPNRAMEKIAAYIRANNLYSIIPPPAPSIQLPPGPRI